MESFNSVFEIVKADFLKRGWSVNPLHRLPHEGELDFQIAAINGLDMKFQISTQVGKRTGRCNITIRLYLENGGILVETSIPPIKRFLLSDIKHPVHCYRLDTQDLPVGVVFNAWRSLGLYGESIRISPTLGFSKDTDLTYRCWLLLDAVESGDWVQIPSEKHIAPPACGLRAVLYELKMLCKRYLEQTTEFGKVIWLQYLIAKFCNFYCSETNPLVHKTLLHILASRVGFRATVRVDSDHWYVLDLDNGVRYRFCRTHPYRAHALGGIVTEELDEKFPGETIQTYLDGTLHSERRLSQSLDNDFDNLVRYANLPDQDVLPWVEFCKLHYGEYGFQGLVESRPEYQLVRRLNKEKK